MACTLGTKSPKVVGNGGTCERSINDIGLLSSCSILAICLMRKFRLSRESRLAQQSAKGVSQGSVKLTGPLTTFLVSGMLIC
jgi:hypothetical protein